MLIACFIVNIIIFTIYINFFHHLFGANINLLSKLRVKSAIFLYIPIIFLISALFMFLSELAIRGHITVFYKLLIYITIQLLLLFIFDKKFIEKFFYFLIYLTSSLSAEAILSSIFSMFFKQVISNIHVFEKIYILFIFFQEFIIGIVIYYIYKNIKLLKAHISSTNKKYFYLSIVALSLIYICVIRLLFLFQTTRYYYIFIILSFSLLAYIVVNYFIFKSTIEYIQMIDNITMANSQLENYKEYKEIVSTYFLETKKFHHDLNNNVLLLINLLENGKIETVLELLEEYKINVINVKPPFDTQNDVLDFILCQKLTYAKTKCVNLEVNTIILDRIHIQQNQIIAILFNLLDNAIDSAAESINKKVNIEICVKNQLFQVIVQNSTFNINQSLENIKNMKSNKSKDDIEHGIGLIIIKTIVENYDGIFEVNVNDDMVQMRVLLNNEILNS